MASNKIVHGGSAPAIGHMLNAELRCLIEKFDGEVRMGSDTATAEAEVPVLSAVLTPHHFHEHATHEEFFKQHMHTKGKELAESCVAIIGQLASVA